jgi:hypothetical protein
LATPYYFKTSSGKVVCEWVDSGFVGRNANSILCGVTTGLKPRIPKQRSACQQLRYNGGTLGMLATGKTLREACMPNGQPFNAPGRTAVLHYGKTWKSGGLACTASRFGLTCHNQDGHGFFLSPARWRTF